MKQHLDQQSTTILHTRIEISRKTKLFKLEELAKGWEMSTRTLFRYDSPQDREMSRIAAKRSTDRNRGRDKSKCQLCPRKLIGHARCKKCTMLLHGKPECGCLKIALTPQI